MSSYKILPYTKQQAKRLNVIVETSRNPNYKIDVFDKNSKQYITSCGDPQYYDYPYYLKFEKNGQVSAGFANERRRLYYIRHQKEATQIGTRGFYSINLLW